MKESQYSNTEEFLDALYEQRRDREIMASIDRQEAKQLQKEKETKNATNNHITNKDTI